MVLVPCKCGCGKLREQYDSLGRIRYFINGHVRKGQHHTEEAKKKASETRKRLYNEGKIISYNKGKKGIKPSEETIQKIRAKAIGRLHSEETKKKISLMRMGNKNPFYGKHHSEETKRKVSIGNKYKIISKETKHKMSLNHLREKNIFWKGGISFKPYTLDFNNIFRESIRERDNYCCVICNRHQDNLGYKLCVHHIDYNKLNSFKENCVSLCKNHHSDTNINRYSWTKFFQSLLKERYGYEYSQDQKIILDFDKVNNV